MMKTLVSLISSVLVLLSAHGCKKSSDPVTPQPPSANAITTGTSSTIGNQTIGQSGGTLTITSAASAVNGLTITVVPNSFAGSRIFMVSEAPITSHTFGEKLSPISPLIRIDNGGGYADSIMTVRVPVRIAPGMFALGFAYDATLGTLEALPVISEDSTGIVIATRHFSQQTGNGGGHLTRINTAKPYMDIVISQLSIAFLGTLGTITTGFTPARDDWEFNNYGSYIAPGGHCAGQSISMMWYYIEHFKKGEQKLFHTLDKLLGYQWDNPLGYRLASVVQCDIDWDSRSREYFLWLREQAPSTQWLAFASAMYVTGEPQYCGIRNDANGWGHAIVANSINVTTGELGVVDPNFHGLQRKILYGTFGFQPYLTGRTAEATNISFEMVGFFAKTGLVDWDKIGNRWQQLLDKTIGNDAFPAVSVEVVDPTYGNYQLTDTLYTQRDSLRLQPSDNSMRISLIDQSGNALSPSATGAYALNPAWNSFGLLAEKDATVDCSGSEYKGRNPRFVQFKWYSIYRQTLDLGSTDPKGAPFTARGVPDSEYTLVGVSGGTAPTNAKYAWDFGDGTSEVTVVGDSTVKHTWKKIGDYTVSLTLYNNATNAMIGFVKKQATIGYLEDRFTVLSFALSNSTGSIADPYSIEQFMPKISKLVDSGVVRVFETSFFETKGSRKVYFFYDGNGDGYTDNGLCVGDEEVDNSASDCSNSYSFSGTITQGSLSACKVGSQLYYGGPVTDWFTVDASFQGMNVTGTMVWHNRYYVKDPKTQEWQLISEGTKEYAFTGKQ